MSDEAAFVKCKLEMLAQGKNEDESPLLVGADGEHSLDITIKVLAASVRAAPAQRTAEQNATVRRDREDARRARMQAHILKSTVKTYFIQKYRWVNLLVLKYWIQKYESGHFCFL